MGPRHDDLPLKPPPEYEDVYRLLAEGAGKLIEAQAWLWERGRRTPNLSRSWPQCEQQGVCSGTHLLPPGQAHSSPPQPVQ